MSNVIKNPTEWLPPQKAPEVFFVLDALMRPVPTHESDLPPLKTKIKPFTTGVVKIEEISTEEPQLLQK